MEKYYTPEIEEFHVGFEYEVNWITTFGSIEDVHDAGLKKKDVREPKSKHAPHRYEIDKWNDITTSPDCYLPDDDDLKLIRVKHLDREDIESLGWSYEHTDAYGVHFVRTVDYDKLSISKSWDDKLFLTLRDDCFVDISNGGSYEDADGVALTIKNKSELKRILKQIGV